MNTLQPLQPVCCNLTPVRRIERIQATRQLEYLGFERGNKVPLRFFYHSDDPRKNGDKGRKLNRLKWEEVERLQSEGRGVYLVVNGHRGGHEDKDISQCIALFCEWDDMPLEEQVLYWDTVGFFEPTFTVYSGDKSMQPYWIFDKPLTNIDQWRELQQLLIEVMNADPANKNPSRVFRLAGGWHIKPGREPVRSEMVQDSGKKYSPDELLMKLREIKQQRQPDQKPLTFTRYEDIQVPVPESVSLEVCLSKESRSLLESGVSEGGRNTNGAKLARDLIGTADHLASIGQRFTGDARSLLEDYGHRCSPPMPSKELETVWRSAQKDGPKPSCPTDYIENNIRAWYWRKYLKPSGRGYGAGGDGGNNIVPSPTVIELTAQQVSSLIDEIIEQGLTGSELHAALNVISHRTPWRIDQVNKLYQQKLADLERVELRDNTREQLESLLSASKATLDLNDYLHPNLAKPLLHLAPRLSLKPELYLTTLLTVASSLHHPLTRIWLSREDDFDQPANLYSAIIAPSSQKKSPVLKAIATKPLRVLQKEADREYKLQVQAYEEEMKAWEKAKGKDKGSPPEKPERKIHFFTKATGEGLEYQAARQPDQGMLYLSDELPSIIYGQNAYRQGRGSDKQDILSYYDGTGHITLRAKEGVRAELDSISLSIHGGIQPKVMQKLLADCEDSDGNWARFMFVNQPAVPAQLHPDGGEVDLTGLLSGLYREIKNLPAAEYTLTPEAFKVYQKAYNRYEQNRVNDPLVGMQSVWGKCEGRVGRLALNLHVINALAANKIPCLVIGAETIRKAIALTDYYAMQVKALYTEFSDSDALAPHLAKVIELSIKRLTSKSEGWLKASDVYLSITKSHRPDGGTVREWFTELVTLGKGEVKGSGRSLLFRAFNPKLDEFRHKLDKSSNAEMTTFLAVQEKLDKLDKLDEFQKNQNPERGQPEPVDKDLDTQGLYLDGLDNPAQPKELAQPEPLDKELDTQELSNLDNLSNLSNNASSADIVDNAALDNPSKKSSNLDTLDKTAQPTELAQAPTIAGEEVSQAEVYPMKSETVIADIAKMLSLCDTKECLAALRATDGFTPAVLSEASKRLPPEKYAQIKAWTIELNQLVEVH